MENLKNDNLKNVLYSMANELIENNNFADITKVGLLLYYVQGYCLAVYDKPIVSEEVSTLNTKLTSDLFLIEKSDLIKHHSGIFFIDEKILNVGELEDYQKEAISFVLFNLEYYGKKELYKKGQVFLLAEETGAFGIISMKYIKLYFQKHFNDIFGCEMPCKQNTSQKYKSYLNP